MIFFRLSGQATAKYVEITLSLADLKKIHSSSFKKGSKPESKKNINVIPKKEKAKKEKEKIFKESVVNDFIEEPKREQKVEKIPDKVTKNTYVKNEKEKIIEKGNTEKDGQVIGMINKETQGKGDTEVYEGKPGEGEGNGLNPDKEKEKFLLEKLYIISKIVQKNITYPYIARKMGWEGKVVVSFVLTKEGKISLLTIEKSSGYDVLDENAIKTIKKVSKYFPLPPLDVKIKLPISYKLD
ncbi:MAG: energy transducer TonB [Thermodesulfobacterium sp.]|nr:energy transducer TonB [Thermodesulfobacterium sp.]